MGLEINIGLGNSLVAKPLHKSSWLIVNWALKNKLMWSGIKYYNCFLKIKNVVWKSSAILSRTEGLNIHNHNGVTLF